MIDRARLKKNLLAAFVLYHLAAVAAANLPGPTSFRPELLDTATARTQLAHASAIARRLGLSLDEPQARALTLSLAPRLIQLRQGLLLPFQPYYALLGTHQPWRLFAFVDQDAGEFHVDLRQRGQDVPLYRPLDPDHRWRASQLDHERARSILASVTAAPGYYGYRPFAAWVAARAFEDFPQATAVRVHVWRYPIPGDRAAGAYEQELLFERP